MTYEIISAIKNRDKLYRKLKSLGKQVNSEDLSYLNLRDRFINARNSLKSQIRKAEKLYLKEFFDLHKSNLMKTWEKLKELIGKKTSSRNLPDYVCTDDGVTRGDTNVADAFNKYFTGVAAKLNESLNCNSNESPINKYLKDPRINTFSFRHTTTNEVLKILNQLKNKSSLGFDNISIKLLKKIFSPLLMPLTTIINQCINTGKFPSLLRIAKVIPLYKKGDTHDMGNYRPISILPAISKLFEKVIHMQITEYFDKEQILYLGQYGFRANHSCEHAALDLIDRISQSITSKHSPFCLFIYLSKAFDTLDHKILLDKLKYYGFDKKALELCNDYLNNRT